MYRDYCAYGGMDIDIRYSSDEIGITGEGVVVLDAALDKYRDYSVSRLVGMARAKGKPWYQVYGKQGGVNEEIPFSLIEQME